MPLNRRTSIACGIAAALAAIVIFIVARLMFVPDGQAQIPARQAESPAPLQDALVAVEETEPIGRVSQTAPDRDVTFSGRVIDSDGRPVASARVAVSIGDAALREYPVDATAAFVLRLTGDSRTTVDATVTAPGFLLGKTVLLGARENVVVLHDAPIQTIEIRFQGERSGVTAVYVFVAKAGGFERFEAGVSAPFLEVKVPLVDSVARIEGVPGDVVDVLMYAEGYCFDLAKSVRVEGTTPRKPARVTMRLDSKGSVFGMVVMQGEGNEPERVRVVAWPIHAGKWPDSALEGFGGSGRSPDGLLAKMGNHVAEAHRRSEGLWEFNVRGLVEGEYFVSAIGEDFVPRSDVARIFVAASSASGPVTLPWKMGTNFVYQIKFQGKTLPARCVATASVDGRQFGGKPADRGTSFDAVPPGLFSIKPMFSYIGSLGRKQSSISTGCESLLAALWRAGGVPVDVRVEPGIQSATTDIDFLVERFERWCSAGGASIAAGGPPGFEPVRTFDKARMKEKTPEAAVARALVSLRTILGSAPKEQLQGYSKTFIDGVVSLDLAEIVRGLCLDAP